jgi:hypothetical protein
MKMIKIKAVCYDDLITSDRDKFADANDAKGVPYCQCCGRAIKDKRTEQGLRLIDGGSYFTEYEGEVACETDLGWWYVGPTCFKKYKKLEKETEVNIGD